METVYPEFLLYSQYTCDVYWENIFKDMSQSLFPPNIYYRTDTSCLVHKPSGDTLFISDLEPQTACDKIYNFLYTHTGLRSHQERIRENPVLNKTYHIQYKEWSEIRKKSLQEILLFNYIIRVRKKYKLTTSQMKALFQNIIIWIQFKILSNQDIIYDPKHNQISCIKNLMISKSGCISLSHKKMSTTDTVSEQPTPSSLYTKWAQMKRN